MAHLNYLAIPKHILILCISLTPALCFALSSDQSQTANIKADTVEYNDKTGISIYFGHVIADQGSTHLSADKVKVYRDKNNRIEKMVGFGKPATYHTLPDGKQHPIQASADSIVYYPGKAKVLLLGHGVVGHKNNRFSGPHIEYDMRAQKIISLPGAHGRTTITLHPNPSKP